MRTEEEKVICDGCIFYMIWEEYGCKQEDCKKGKFNDIAGYPERCSERILNEEE